MKCKVKGLILLILTSFILTACSSNIKPDDVSQEFWDGAIQNAIYAKILKEEGYTDLENFGAMDTNKEDLSETEKKIRDDLYDTYSALIVHSASELFDEDGKVEAEQEFNEVYAKLEETFGKGNLKIENFDESRVEEMIAESATKSEQSNIHRMEKVNEEFKNDYSISLDSIDVQYDMPNNLNNRFFIGGTLEICDYYNYGFTDDNTFFCGEMTPDDGTDSWYVYFDRNKYSGVYDKLLTENLSARISAIIPEKMYKKNQGNMAKVDHIAFDLN